MIFYPCRDNSKLNKKPWQPDLWVGRAMINPHYPKGYLDWTEGAHAVIDSTAFQTAIRRKTPDEALDKQLKTVAAVQAKGGIIDAIVHYDQVLGVDEVVVDYVDSKGRTKQKLKKQRGTEDSARAAVEETIRCARVYHQRHSEVPVPIAYSAQGANPDQYLACVAELLPLLRPKYDWLALGGFCIIGPERWVRPAFYETCRRVFPLAAARQVPRVHILGVTTISCLRVAQEMAKESGITLSTDGSGPEQAGCRYGKKMCADGTARPLAKLGQPARKWLDYHPNDLARENICLFSDLCSSL